MPKPSHRETLLRVGMQVVHERGFVGASVRDIVRAAGVPQGSFTNHFRSKEVFGLAVIDLYAADALETLGRTLGNETLPPLQRLAAYLDSQREAQAGHAMRDGCLLGNLAAEANECGEPMRLRLEQAFAAIRAALAACLRAAAAAGEIDPATDCDDLAAWIVASLQGASLLAKTERSAAPLDRFARILFGRVLAAPRD